MLQGPLPIVIITAIEVEDVSVMMIFVLFMEDISGRTAFLTRMVLIIVHQQGSMPTKVDLAQEEEINIITMLQVTLINQVIPIIIRVIKAILKKTMLIVAAAMEMLILMLMISRKQEFQKNQSLN